MNAIFRYFNIRQHNHCGLGRYDDREKTLECFHLAMKHGHWGIRRLAHHVLLYIEFPGLDDVHISVQVEVRSHVLVDDCKLWLVI